LVQEIYDRRNTSQNISGYRSRKLNTQHSTTEHWQLLYSWHWTNLRASLMQFIPTQPISERSIYLLLYPFLSESSKWPLLKRCSHQKLGNWNSSKLFITEYEYSECFNKYTVLNLPWRSEIEFLVRISAVLIFFFFLLFSSAVLTLLAKNQLASNDTMSASVCISLMRWFSYHD
jgi:hypothetical protein